MDLQTPQVDAFPACETSSYSNKDDIQVTLDGEVFSNLESLTYSVYVETIPEFDENDKLIGYKRGKQCVVGSLLLSQVDRHGLDVLLKKYGVGSGDQLPPVDLTLRVKNAVHSSYTRLEGVMFTQETGGFSLNDLGNSVGLSFVAHRIVPWQSAV